MNPFRKGLIIGMLFAFCLVLFGVGAVIIFLDIDPHETYFFNKEGIRGAYIIHAPERDTHERVQNLIEANLIVLNIALEQPNEVARVLALRYWAIVLLCGMDPHYKECGRENLSPSPKVKKL